MASACSCCCPRRGALARILIERNFRSRLVVSAANLRRRGSSPYDVDSTAHDIDRTQLPESKAQAIVRTVAFGDLDGRIWGAAVDAGCRRRVGGGRDVLPGRPAGAAVDPDRRGWRLEGDGFDLRIEPRGEESEPGENAPTALCQAPGALSRPRHDPVDGAEIDCVGARTELEGLRPGAAVRGFSGWFGRGGGDVAGAAPGPEAHERDLVAATVFEPERWMAATTRGSRRPTTAGHPTRATLELWIRQGEREFPRRAAGEARGAGGSYRGRRRLELRVCHCGATVAAWRAPGSTCSRLSSVSIGKFVSRSREQTPRGCHRIYESGH